MEKFNSDTNALMSRAQINAAGAKYDLEEWILQLLPPLRGLHVLDLGCGTGKQVFRLAPLVTDAGSILGIDISPDAVAAVQQRAVAESLHFVSARQHGLDDCLEHLADNRFDLIVSSYAIYYAQDLAGLLKGLRSLLNDGGTLFVCGPGEGTNREMQDLVMQCTSDEVKRIPDFITAEGIDDVASSFTRHTVARLGNRIAFDSAGAVLSWWKNHNSFDSTAVDAVEKFLNKHFSQNSSFELTKNVLGVRFDG
jgi:ubiquinone/menaquinone biosynthesis C-methylase UbiE